MEMNNIAKYLRSPINYMGGKYRSLSYIIPNFPKNIKTFYDVFGGSGTVMMNTEAQKYKYNEAVTPLRDLLKYIGEQEPESVIKEVEDLDAKFNLQTQSGFDSLRGVYNQDQRPEMLYALINHAFNYLIRFNKSGGYNASSGKGICKLSDNNIEKLQGYYSFVKDKSVEYHSEDFRDFLSQSEFSEGDYLYFDPPYDISEANYNENRGFVGWSKKDGEELLKILIELNNKGVQWGYSNMLSSKGVVNQALIDWINENDFTIHTKEVSYNGVPSTRLDLDKSVEVFITNVK